MRKLPCAALVLAFAAGCGGTGNLSGKVSFEKKLVVSGTVQAVGSDGKPRPCLISAEGTYTIQDLPVGTVKLLVHSPKPGEEHMRKPDEKPKKVDTSKWFEIPPKYGDFSTSELTYEIKRGDNVFDIDLK